jgi:HIRAN domain
MVAGTLHEGRLDTIRENLREDQRVFLVREPDNAYDKNAVRIDVARGGAPIQRSETSFSLQCIDIGYVPREVAAEVAPLLDAGFKQVAVCSKLLRRAARGPIPIIDVAISPRRKRPGGRYQSELGARCKRSS